MVTERFIQTQQEAKQHSKWLGGALINNTRGFHNTANGKMPLIKTQPEIEYSKWG